MCGYPIKSIRTYVRIAMAFLILCCCWLLPCSSKVSTLGALAKFQGLAIVRRLQKFSDAWTNIQWRLFDVVVGP